jgi:uncharacterized protein with HEPN domain
MSEKGRDYILFLEDIVAALDKIEKYSGTLTYEQFSGNAMVIDAVIRNFEIIGEATKSIPKEVQEKYHAVEWKEAAGFRDVLIHDYFGIDIEALWDTIKNNLPAFSKHIALAFQAELAQNKRSEGSS